ncbi:hypothetical protein [Enterobacter sichuanensis]|uniref:hypothetical protein n=1 Tax=Enterobacter sichuanensis TaxID=2071710 RepID=UPI0012A7A06F|nr:hypothetical protein [Enterobacter sichuanensis]QFQ07247.1 hypothetical protein C1N69_00435 [Enterobacter sichuanensis]HDR2782462.1 hypothetical protein [Enterobacter sichuanensis]
MSLPMPWSLAGRLFKWGWEKITRLWLLKTYQKSHEYKFRRYHLGAHWKPLGEHLEYSVRLAHSADHESVKSRVAFRTKGALVENLSLYFEASGHGIRYQQKIELANLDQSVLIVNLNQIPRQELMEVSERGIYFSITETKFIQCVITLPGGKKQPSFNSQRFSLMHGWLLRDTWERRWGVVWNCNAIEDAKTEMKSFWRWRLGEYRYFSLNYPSFRPLTLNGMFRKGLCRLLINPHLITLQFWLAIHSGRYTLGDGRLMFSRKRIKKMKSRKMARL